MRDQKMLTSVCSSQFEFSGSWTSVFGPGEVFFRRLWALTGTTVARAGTIGSIGAGSGGAGAGGGGAEAGGGGVGGGVHTIGGGVSGGGSGGGKASKSDGEGTIQVA